MSREDETLSAFVRRELDEGFVEQLRRMVLIATWGHPTLELTVYNGIGFSDKAINTIKLYLVSNRWRIANGINVNFNYVNCYTSEPFSQSRTYRDVANRHPWNRERKSDW